MLSSKIGHQIVTSSAMKFLDLHQSDEVRITPLATVPDKWRQVMRITRLFCHLFLLLKLCCHSRNAGGNELQRGPVCRHAAMKPDAQIKKPQRMAAVFFRICDRIRMCLAKTQTIHVNHQRTDKDNGTCLWKYRTALSAPYFSGNPSAVTNNASCALQSVQ